MNKVLLFSAVLVVGGCGMLSSDNVEDIRQKTVAICGYLPTAQTVAAIISAGNPAVTGVGAVAQAICNAVSKAPQGLYSATACPEVNGVCVEGDWVEMPKEEKEEE